MNRGFDESSARRFCAQWHIFFSSDTPTCLRLRPIASCRHPLRNRKASVRVSQEATRIIAAEIELVDKTINAIPDVLTFRDLVNGRPEFAAFQLAAKLYAQGHHEQYLLRLESIFASMFGLEEERHARKESRLYKSMSSDGECLDVRNLVAPQKLECYFCVDTKRTVRASNFKILDFSELPQEVAQKFSEDTALPEAQSKKYLKHSNLAIDPHIAVEEATKELLNSESRNVMRPRAANLDLSDLHKNVVIFQNGRYARFNWLEYKLAFPGLHLDKKKISEFSDRIDRSESFKVIVAAFSAAAREARQNNCAAAFRLLVEGMDSLFRPMAEFSNERYTSGYFINCAARFMAIDAQHVVFGQCYREFRSFGGAAGIQRLKEVNASALYQTMHSDLAESYRKYRIINLASFVTKSLANLRNFRDALKKTRFDFFVTLHIW